MNYLLCLDSHNQSNTSDFTVRLTKPFDLKKLQYRCSLLRLDSFFSWYNVSASQQNNIFKYNNGVVDKQLVLEDGLYSSMDELINEIHDMMRLEGDYTVNSDGEDEFDIDFELDLQNLYMTLILTNGYSVDFTNMNIRTIFGFESQVYNASTVSPNRADIRNGVNAVFVHLNIVNGASAVNDVTSDIIYTFSVNHQSNEVLSFEPNPLYLPINVRSQLESVRLYLTDQRGRSLSLNGAPLTASFSLEPDLRA